MRRRELGQLFIPHFLTPGLQEGEDQRADQHGEQEDLHCAKGLFFLHFYISYQVIIPLSSGLRSGSAFFCFMLLCPPVSTIVRCFPPVLLSVLMYGLLSVKVLLAGVLGFE